VVYRLVILVLLCYSVSSANAAEWGLDPLSTPVRTIHLASFDTIGEGADYYLSRVGYTLLTQDPAPYYVRIIADSPIPPSVPGVGTAQINHLLLLMSGEGYNLIVDTKHKLVYWETEDAPKYITIDAARVITDSFDDSPGGVLK